MSLGFLDKTPLIKSIAPEVGNPGDILVISGRNFSSSAEDSTRQWRRIPLGSEVSIAGIRLPTSAFLEWTDRRIRIRIPEEIKSGFVFVSNRYGRSQGVLFTNRKSIPVIVSGPTNPGQPYIEALGPKKGSVGTLIIITGKNFGNSRGNSVIFFSPVSITGDISSGDESPLEYVPGTDTDFDYESWTDTEIKIRVPDGASSGNVFVSTDRGKSNAEYFELLNEVGTRVYTHKRGFQLDYGVNIINVQAEKENSLYLWVPKPWSTPNQRKIERNSLPDPLFQDINGVMLYRLDNLMAEESYDVSQVVWLNRYETQMNIFPQKVKIRYEQNRELYKYYTKEQSSIPKDNGDIRKTAMRIVGNERNPYKKAKAIFNYIRENMRYAESDSTDIEAGLKTKSGNAYVFAFLFATLARATDIPTRPVAGYIVYGNKEVKQHYWDEFYLQGFGWVPVDPLLGSGVRFSNFPQRDLEKDYYFGNLDNQHLTFSQGIVQLKPMTTNGRTVIKNNMYALQTIWEEAVGNIQGYKSFWRPLKIIDWW